MNYLPRRRLLPFVLLVWIAAPLASAGDRDVLADIKAELDRRETAGLFSGAVMIARGDTVLFGGAYGLGDIAGGSRNSIETRFRFGSMGKMFTAVAVLQLVQAGTVRLDDAVGHFLPDYPNHEVARVTVQELLTHTGGTGDVFGPDFEAHRDELRTLGDYVKLFGSRGVEFQPGTRHRYSNYGFILLGRIVEVVTGRPYDEYVDDRVFGAAGMRNSGNTPETVPVAGLAIPYTQGARGGSPSREWHSAAGMLPYRGTSAGGGYSTVGDLVKFAHALEGAKLLRPDLVDLATHGKVDGPAQHLRYGLGFEDALTPGGARRIGHGGGAPGMNGVLCIYPDSRLVIVVLANRDPPAADDMARYIEDRVVGRGDYLPR